MPTEYIVPKLVPTGPVPSDWYSRHDFPPPPYWKPGNTNGLTPVWPTAPLTKFQRWEMIAWLDKIGNNILVPSDYGDSHILELYEGAYEALHLIGTPQLTGPGGIDILPPFGLGGAGGLLGGEGDVAGGEGGAAGGAARGGLAGNLLRGGNAISNLEKAAGAGAVLAALLDPHLLARFGEIAVGIILIGVGVAAVLRNNKPAPNAKQVGFQSYGDVQRSLRTAKPL